MRILHVVALASPDGAYGGPLRVALNQVRALRAAGHDAILVAGQAGYGPDVPDTIGDVPTRLFRARRAFGLPGFGSLTAPLMLGWLRTVAPRADIVHVHLARDLLTAPAALVARATRVPYVVQTHGMVLPPKNAPQRMYDAMITRRALSGARVAYVLNDDEAVALRRTGIGGTPVSLLLNGIELPALPASAREPSVPEGNATEGLFLGRLHPRKRPAEFARAAISVASRHPNTGFAIVGPDEGEYPAVESAIRSAPSEVAARVRLEGALPPDRTAERMSRADFFVLPSLDEPFGMAALEAMSVGKPVIVTDSCGLATAVRDGDAGIVVDSSEAALETAMERMALDADLRRELGANARRLVAEQYTIDRVVDRLVADYSDAVSERVER